MSILQIVILSWLGFDIVVYIAMWLEHHKTLSHLATNIQRFLTEINDDE